MTVSDEQKMVVELRDQGMTIAAIAQKVGKSNHWVYSRLNDDYAPKRSRKTAGDTLEPLGDLPDTPLSDELKAVYSMRAEGLTYEQIASTLDRSVYWVHSRLDKKYRPSAGRAEHRFQKEAVIPYLKSDGHEIVSEFARPKFGDFSLEADIVSVQDGQVWVSEVKAKATGHQFHTAIGQLLLHRCLNFDAETRFQVVLPASSKSKRLSDALLDSVREGLQIEVVFIDWDD